ncbi:MAG: phosphoribosylanthranilate isomerase [Nitrososphaerota archaeon]|nr:phosphoribosylanthranilate isomerase [Nitrososphaerota archaeon]MDG6923798.1 phosphoribosylanthranilate isomerase [Nitrososphaerota archaeon]
MTVKVKICGLTNKSDVELAIDSGADALGFIFGYPASPRNLTFSELKELLSSVSPFVCTVVVSPSSNTQLSKASKLNPSYFQLYYDSKVSAELRNLSNVIQTVRPHESSSMINDSILYSSNCRAIHIDASLTSRYASGKERGGLALRQIHAFAKKVRDAIAPIPLIFGGGLTHENVAGIVRELEPYAVDVSSGVEKKPGTKDQAKVVKFIRNAKGSIS